MEIFKSGVPILAICYGQQTLCEQLGGKVESGDAAEFGRAEVVADAIYSAYFTEGRDIGAMGELLAIARQTGLPDAELRRLLESDEAIEQIHGDNLRAHRLGINGAPCFILGRRHAIAGAQEPEVLECLLNVAALDLGDD